MMPSIAGTDAAYKIVQLWLIVERNVRHVRLPAIEQERLTFRAIVIYGYEQKEEAIFNGST